MVALYMAVESVQRLLHPLKIEYRWALVVAVIGLIVNLISAFMLNEHHGGHCDSQGEHEKGHVDLNLRAAYLHVLADAATSVLAIVALLGGRYLNWTGLDPAMGIVGACVISVWAYRLLGETSRVLLDREMDDGIVKRVREALETNQDTHIADLHVWRVGRAKFACIVSIVSHNPKTVEEYKALLKPCAELAHVTVEVAACPCGESAPG